jgi:23S rRNA (pseudouridine1915-N3)-methyltransferase
VKITFLHPGRFKSAEYEALFENYLKLASRFATTSAHELVLQKNIKEQAAQDDALLRWLDRHGSRVHLTILDERGKSFDSRGFATRLEKMRDGSFTECVFAAGGAHGYGESVRSRAQLLWSLSSMTFPHELACVIAAEQIFRGLSILHNHPYHND